MINVRKIRRILFGFVTSLCILLSWSLISNAQNNANPKNNQPLFSDAHFHLTNYIQKGIKASNFLKMVGQKVERVAIFGIPLQQKWDYFVDGNRAPDYYLMSDSELYYYSFVDAMIAREYMRLSPAERQHFDPMITGFNPTDMYAADHITRVLKIFPGVFSGIGEFTIHKEFVSGKVSGHTASLTNQALARILDVAGETGLVVILHCDIDTVRPAVGPRPAYLDEMERLFQAHQNATIIWAHTGLGRIVAPRANHLNYLTEILENPIYNHVMFDISWDEVAKYVAKNPQKWAALINQYPDRFLFGSDAVAPKNNAAYFKTYEDYQPLWQLLDATTSRKVRLDNYARIFDAAKTKVRAWEAKQLNEADQSGIHAPQLDSRELNSREPMGIKAT
jgi:hypothetical protein